MNKKDFNIRSKVIENTFNDKRKIVAHMPNEELGLRNDIHQPGDIFITDDGEFIDLEFQLQDFTEDELINYIELAEELYEKFGKTVSIYLICPNDITVYVNEHEIKSEASFTIKLACINEDPCKIILEGIKAKLKNNEILDEDDLQALSMLQVMCKKEERRYYRKEYLKIINKLHY